MKKEETVVEVLLRFLKGEEAGAPAPLVSRNVGGVIVLSSYGVPLAEVRGDEVVVKALSDDDMIPVRRKHRKWLEVIAQERSMKLLYE